MKRIEIFIGPGNTLEEAVKEGIERALKEERQKEENPKALKMYISALKAKTPTEVSRLLQTLERDKYDYEEAKRLIEHYEHCDCNNDLMIEACEIILKDK